MKWVVSTLVIIASLVSFYFVSTSVFFKVNNIEVVGNTRVSTESIKALVKNILTTKKLGLLAKDTIFFTPEKDIANALTGLVDISNAFVETSGRTLIIKVIEYEPYALWCTGESEYLSDDTQCSFMTKEGHILEVASSTNGLKYFGTLESTSTPFSILSKAVDKINAVIPIRTVALHENGEYVLHTDQGDILMRSKQSLDVASDNVIVFLNAHMRERFKSIDARHGNSIFYTYAPSE